MRQKVRWFGRGLAVALMLTAASPAVAAPANKEAGGLEAAFERFVAAAVAEDCKTVLKTGEPMLRRHDKQMTSEGQAYVLGVLAACAGTDGNRPKRAIMPGAPLPSTAARTGCGACASPSTWKRRITRPPSKPSS